MVSSHQSVVLTDAHVLWIFRADAALIASKGMATSISFFLYGWLMREPLPFPQSFHVELYGILVKRFTGI